LVHPVGTAIKNPVPDRVKPSFVIFDIRALYDAQSTWVIATALLTEKTRKQQSFTILEVAADWHELIVRKPGCQKLQNDGLTWSGTGCFIAVPIWQQWASKG